MDNKEIAQRLAKIVYYNGCETDGLAIQLFVERTTLPSGTRSYSQQELRDAIFDYLEKNFR